MVLPVSVVDLVESIFELPIIIKSSIFFPLTEERNCSISLLSASIPTDPRMELIAVASGFELPANRASKKAASVRIFKDSSGDAWGF